MFTKRGVWVALLFVASSIIFGFVSHVAAENVTVTIGVGDTVLVVNGKTSPQAFVTIKSDDSVIGTTTALADGSYSKTFSAQSSGFRRLSVSAHTTGGATTDTVTVELGVIEHATTTVELFLPPTVVVNDSSLERNQPLALKGESSPMSTIKLFLDDAEYATTTSDASGAWNMSIDSDSFASGQHQFFLRAFDTGGTQSYPTVSRSFSFSKTERNEEFTQPGPNSSTAPLTPPVIVFPVSGTSWDKSEITVRGTAPEGVQVELWDGTRLLGSAWSDNEGDWSLKLLLESREYNLRARACLNDQCSDFSSMTLFTYNSIHDSLYVRVPRTSLTVVQGEPITLTAEVVHGRTPYQTKLYWGNEAVDTVKMTTDNMSFTHTYDVPGKYTAVLELQDSRGQYGGAQFAIHVKNAPSQGAPLHLVMATIVAAIIALPVAAHLLHKYRIRHKTP